MGRSPCCEKVGLKKGPWTPEEDQKLLAHIEEHGHGSWRALPAKAGLQRCGKSCRLRWTNYLRPDIKRGKFSLQEEQTIIQLHALLGNRWSAIATHLPKRTDNEIKNYWNTHLKKRLTKMGIDPVTHKPKIDTLGSSSGNPKDAANLSHMAQWESARLEAETRLVRESKLIVAAAAAKNPTSVGPAQQAHRSYKSGPGPSHAPPPCLDILKAWQSSWSTRSNPNNVSINSNNNKYNSNSNALLCMLAMDDLESPTSTLNFPTATTVVPSSLALFSDEDNNNNNNEENDMSFQAFGCTDGVANGWFLNHDNNVMDSVDTNTTTTTTTTMCNVMESFGDVFTYDATSEEDPANDGGDAGDGGSGDGSCSGASGFFDIQENKSYWNSILNLVNASPSSPVF